MKTGKSSFRNLFLLSFVLLNTVISSPGFAIQDDTVQVNDVTTPPVIDGSGDDGCWASAGWQNIDQVWINYGEALDSYDFNGRYKAVWSSKENLLYFLVEASDDVTIGGFMEGQTADVYNYDITEVFIDENRSGGPHINDNSGTGENAENAFAYHIYADFPQEGEVNKTCWVGDIPIPVTHHLPEFAIRKTGDLCTREFSLKVYGETYDNNDPENSRVILTKGKVMGLSIAYCDNDEDDGQRDNFYGSVWVPAANFNNHWMNADDFGVAKLFSAFNPDPVIDKAILPVLRIYPNPASDYLCMEVNDAVSRVEILDIHGKVLSGYTPRDQRFLQIPLNLLSKGIFCTRITTVTDGFALGKFIKK